MKRSRTKIGPALRLITNVAPHLKVKKHRLIEAARKGLLSKEDKNSLSKSRLNNEQKLVLFFCCCAHGQLQLLPSSFRSAQRLLDIETQAKKLFPSCNPIAEMIYFAIQYDALDLLPDSARDFKFETWRTQSGYSLLAEAVRSGKELWVKRERFTSEGLEMYLGINRFRESTVTHYLADRDLLHLIPDGVLTRAHLRLQNRKGETAVHSAARSGCLHLMAELLDYKCLARKSKKDGLTPVHILAGSGQMDQIPEKLRLPSIIFCLDRKGRTANRFARECGSETFPQHYMTRDFLLGSSSHALPTAVEMARYGMANLLENLNPGMIRPDEIAHAAKRTANHNKQNLGTPKLWFKHFQNSPVKKLEEIKSAFPDNIRKDSDSLIDSVIAAIEAPRLIREAAAQIAV